MIEREENEYIIDDKRVRLMGRPAFGSFRPNLPKAFIYEANFIANLTRIQVVKNRNGNQELTQDEADILRETIDEYKLVILYQISGDHHYLTGLHHFIPIMEYYKVLEIVEPQFPANKETEVNNQIYHVYHSYLKYRELEFEQ